MNTQQEIARRRTFGIISHPDAGKTTLTEKLLLFGGAIQSAGAVKSNKVKKSAASDFMEIEKQRGISVSTSVMAFEYQGHKINILDTPGHKDFAEDTYRTLTAVDSVIVVIDVAKGVEMQTEKLVEVCRMRKTPMIVFINKLDRVGKDAFDLLDEIEQKLGLNVRPMSFPVGMGMDFKGVYNLHNSSLYLFDEANKTNIATGEEVDVDSEVLVNKIGQEAADILREELELVKGVYPDLDIEEYKKGDVSPVFFGSALNNFGVKELLETFIEVAPAPQAKISETRLVDPEEDKFSGFVFKIHANMDPKHRDRIAFVKVVSGVFERNKNYLHVREGRKMKFSNPTTFLAEKKEVVDKAYPGDIVGLHDTGLFKIGDTLTEGEQMMFKGIPSFSPENFKYIENADPLKTKQLNKGINQLMDEGVAQMFYNKYTNRKIVGTVGALQFDVIQYRLEHEYGAKSRWESVSIHKACWVTSENEEQLKDFIDRKQRWMAKDKWDRDVFLAESRYTIDQAQSNFPDLEFHFKSDF